ncbi:MAG: TlpA family protein disulfide reductase [Proteobacteria bacterium]|nr:TlpA family protein disulfide reductase [Pseudomonadota bacterium]
MKGARWLALALLGGLAAPVWAHGLVVGAVAPQVTTTTLDGRPFDLAADKGKVVVVHFWATWCEPCRIEMPAMEAFFRAHKDEGLAVIAISLDEPGDLARVKDAMHGISYPTALLSATQAKGYGRIWRVPLTFVIDRRGNLRRDGFKYTEILDAAALDREVLPLLREK